MYYIYDDNNEIVDKSNAFDDSRLQMFSTKDILLDKLALFDGEIYDIDDIEYWRLRRTKELNEYCIAMENGSYMADGILMDCNEKSVTKLSLGLQMYQINNTPDDYIVNVVDYNNNINQMPLSEFKEIAKSVGSEYSNRYLLKWTNREKLKSNDIDIVKSILF